MGREMEEEQRRRQRGGEGKLERVKKAEERRE